MVEVALGVWEVVGVGEIGSSGSAKGSWCGEILSSGSEIRSGCVKLHLGSMK